MIKLFLPVSTVVFLTSTLSESAEAPGVAAMRSEINANYERAHQIQAQIEALKRQRTAALDEITRGEFCSGCGGTRSEIEARGERFPHRGQDIVHKSMDEILARRAAKDKEYRDKIASLNSELSRLNVESQRLYVSAVTTQAQFDKAAFQAFQAKRIAEAKAKQLEREKSIRDSEANLKKTTDNLSATVKSSLALVEEEKVVSQFLKTIENDRPLIPEEQKEFFKAVSDEMRSETPLSATAKQKQDRLQDMAKSRLTSGPSNSDESGIAVASDNVSSVWSRAFDLKDKGSELAESIERLVTNDRPDLVERLKLIVQNAGNQTLLGERVVGQLDSAVDSLLSGDSDSQNKVRKANENAMSLFASEADANARKMSPEYDTIRATQEVSQTMGSFESSPASPGRSRSDRSHVPASAWDIATSESQSGSKSEGNQPLNTNGSNFKRWENVSQGPLPPGVANFYSSAGYTEYTTDEDVILYSVDNLEETGSAFWSRTRGKIGTIKIGAERIHVPAGTKFFEGTVTRPGSEDKASLIYLRNVDAAWRVR